MRCVAQTGQHFGIGVITETLCGADTDKVRKYHMDQEPGYGVLRDFTQKEVRERIQFLLDEGILALSGGPYPVLELGERAAEIGEDGGPLTMRMLREDRPVPARKAVQAELDGPAAELFQRLRALRARDRPVRGSPPMWCLPTRRCGRWL